jgi:excisionase family DNA binding protein
MSDELLLPIWPEGARRIGVGRTVMFDLVKSGAIETVRIGRKRMVAPDALAAYVEKLRKAA